MQIKDRDFATQLLIKYNDLLQEDPFVILEEFTKRGEKQENYNKFMAGRTIIETNFYWSRLPQFLLLSDAITYGRVYYDTIPMASVESIGWSVLEAVILTPDLAEVRLDDNVKAYIKQRVKFEKEYPFTLKRFLDDPNNDFEKFESADINNWLIVGIKQYIKAIKEQFKDRGETILPETRVDLEKKFAFFGIDVREALLEDISA
ncbi:MAG: hypothetical protein QW303_04095 [Nitrososphaerota archaeon]